MKSLTYCLLVLFCLYKPDVFAQSLIGESHYDSVPDLKISTLSHPVTLNPYSLVLVDSSCTREFKNISPSLFKNDTTGYFENTIPLADTQYPFYFSFRALNDTKDTSTLFIYVDPERTLQLCSTTEAGQVITHIALQHDDHFFIEQQFFELHLAPGQLQRYVLRIEFPQTHFSYVSFWAGPYQQLEDFVWFHFGIDIEMCLVNTVFLGMIIMMLIYMSSKYIQIGKREYLYYAAYTFCFVTFFIIKSMEMLEIPIFYTSPLLHSLLYRLSQLLAYWMYYLFIQEFLSSKIIFPRAHKLINLVITFIISYALLEVIMFFIPETYELRWKMWDVARLIIAITGLAFTISFIFVGNVLSRYLVAGGSALAFFGMLSMLFSAYPSMISRWPEVFSHGLFYFEIGILIELLFFALGLGHKNRMDEIEKVEAKEALKVSEERQHIKHLHALSEVQERERSRFAKDLHDGLGGMLWGVKLSLSNMKGNMVLTQDQIPVFERSLDMLDNSIHELRRVAHNLMPEALVKFGLAAALKDFCDFINSSKVVAIIFQQVGEEKRADISAEVVLFRIINELVNNALRHASATEIILQLNYDDTMLTITVEDNGIGFDKSILAKTTGSGWPNIKSRVEYLKGSLDIDTSPNNGTAINITVPV